MARKETCILTNMCMVYQDNRVLVQNRTDPNWPGICFPGGHIEPGESFVDSTIREIKEETGLDISDLQLCGVKQWTQPNGEYRYIVFLYKTGTFSGAVNASSEGEVFWADRESLPELPLADGFSSMLEIFLRDELTENYHWLDDGQWKFTNK